jgi:hypothetical protein
MSISQRKRECGSCSMCCKIMTVPDFAGKPDPHDWCQHAIHAPKTGVKDTLVGGCGGCAIYPQRPDNCRDFHCMWLLDQRIPDYWFPAKSKIVISPHLADVVTLADGRKRPGEAYIAFIVDPAYPNRWREEPWFSDLKKMAKAGLTGLLGQKWTSVVLIGDERIPIVA